MKDKLVRWIKKKFNLEQKYPPATPILVQAFPQRPFEQRTVNDADILQRAYNQQLLKNSIYRVSPRPVKEFFNRFPAPLQQAVEFGCKKVIKENPPPYFGSSLGRNRSRDEACEWSKLWLIDHDYEFRDSDVHLACELYYIAHIRK